MLKRQFNALISEPEYEALRDYAFEHRMSLSKAARQAVVEKLNVNKTKVQCHWCEKEGNEHMFSFGEIIEHCTMKHKKLTMTGKPIVAFVIPVPEPQGDE